MSQYRIDYYSSFAKEWQEFVPATWNARPVRHATREEAEARVAHLQHDYPRDTFRITEA